MAPETTHLPDGLDTPALVVDLVLVRANIARLQGELDGRGVRLRPHVKTHKSVRIARLQLEAGAAGITAGTLGEAEVVVASGIADVFVAYPVWAVGPKAARLRALHDAADLVVGVDSGEAAARLAAAVAGGRRPLRVLVEVDSGGRRSGVADPEAVLATGEAARSAGLVVEGVFTHGGHGYSPGAAGDAAADEVRSLELAARALESGGFTVTTTSAGSTPTAIAAAAGRVNEIRAGTYVLGDRIQWTLGACPADGLAASVAATVVSVAAGRFVLDAGAKSLTKDRPEWLEGFGLVSGYPSAVIERLYDYHAVVSLPDGAAGPGLGDVVAVIPNHVCPVVDLFDSFVAIEGDGSTEPWPVDARGRSG